MWRILSRGYRRGFTFIELVISLGLFAVILSVMSFAYFVTLRAWGYDLNRIEAKSEPNIALEKFWKDLESATAITLADVQRISFNSPGGSIDFTWNPVNRRLRRTQAGQIRGLANRISNLDLNYYDSSGAVLSRPVATLGNIRTIEIFIQGQISYMFSSETVDLRSRISPRNLK